MRETHVYVAAVLVVCVLLAGCSGPRERLETLDEYMAEYNAARKKANEKPNVVQAVERAVKLMGQESLSETALDEYLVFWKETRTGGGNAHVYTSGKLRATKSGVPKTFREEVMANGASFAEVRKARTLPAGLIPLDPKDYLSETMKFGSDARHLAISLGHAALIELADGELKAARERCFDMLTLERALADAPPILSQLSRTAVAGAAGNRALSVAVGGPWTGEELDEMAAALESLDRSPVDVLRRALRLDRAWALHEIRRFESMSDKALAEHIDGFYRAQERLDTVIGRHDVKRKRPTVSEVRRMLPGDREVVVARFREHELALSEPGTRLRDAGPSDTSCDEPKELGLVGFVVCPKYWGSSERALTTDCAQRRAAIALLRALAFRARKGRLPRADELEMPEDPFRPGERMTYVHDKKNGRIGVYAIGWPREALKPRKDPGDDRTTETVESPRIGRWLILEGKQAGEPKEK